MVCYERELFERLMQSGTVTNLELIISPQCNLQCTYCYMKRHNLGSQSPVMDTSTINDSIRLWATVTKNNNPFDISLFGGEPLMQLDIVEYILKLTEHNDLVKRIIIPTNAYFVNRDVENLMSRFPKLHLSLSVDGPFWDPKFRRPREEYQYLKLDYDYLISLYYKFSPRVGFHPMIYAEGVEDTFKTFKYFLTSVNDRSQAAEELIYFLPVRNPGTWSRERISTLIHQLRECYQFAKDNNYPLIKVKYNILGDFTIPRGVTCTLQQTLTVAWDGNLYPCHRLIYPQYLYGNISNYPNWNFNRFFAFQLYHRNNTVPCQHCAVGGSLKCMGGCLGAQYEYFGDPFVPIPEICQLLKAMTLNYKFITKQEDTYVLP